jgi:hypothetical protein
VLGFEPRSEAPQASRIIQCSGPGRAPRTRSYPTRAFGSCFEFRRAEGGRV